MPVRHPDTFVTLEMKSAVEGTESTFVAEKSSSPEWNETFEFFCLQSQKGNVIVLKLWDAGCVWNSLLGETSIPLDGLPLDEEILQTVTVGKDHCEIDLSFQASQCSVPDLRYSAELWEEEEVFLLERKKVVFNALTDLFAGDSRAPNCLHEVPVVGIVGSGGGLRAVVGLCGALKALEEMKVLDCVTYMSTLSGSSWYASTLYGRRNGPTIDPSGTLSYFRNHLNRSYWSEVQFAKDLFHFEQHKMGNKIMSGQPTGFIDYYGFYVGEQLLIGKLATETKLSEQKALILHGQSPLPIYTSVRVKKAVDARLCGELIEHTPYGTGIPARGAFMRTELFGSKFYAGHVVKRFPEPSISFLQGLWSSVYASQLQRRLSEGPYCDGPWKEDSDISQIQETSKCGECEELAGDAMMGGSGDQDRPEGKPTGSVHEGGMLQRFRRWILCRTDLFKTRIAAPYIFNFLKGVISKKSQECAPDDQALMMVVDAGLHMTLPYPALLRKERAVDVFLSFDFSGRECDSNIVVPFEKLEQAAKWAREHGVRFPTINGLEQFKEHGWKECYVFQDPADPECPIVLHFILNNISYRDYVEPGVPREGRKQKEEGDFTIFDDVRFDTYKTRYSNLEFDQLSGLVEYNVRMNREVIMRALADSVVNLRERSESD